MADEAKGIPTWVWILVAVVVLWFLAKKTVAAANKAAGSAGYGAGKGAVDAVIEKGPGVVSAIGSFFGGLFDSKGSGGAGPGGRSSAFTDDVDLGDFDTSNYSVSNGFEFTDASGNFIAG